MTADASDPGLSGAMQWLEEEQRGSKAQALKLQQQLEQIQATLWTIGDRVNALEAAVSTVMAHGSRVARLEEDLRQAKELLDRLQTLREADRQQALADERARQPEIERQRQMWAEMAQRHEALDRDVAGLRDKQQALEDASRRRQEEIFQLDQRLEPLHLEDENLGQRLTSAFDQLKRHAQELEELHQEQRSLHGQDEVIQGRVQHLGDQVRRLEGSEEVKELEHRMTGALAEQSELSRIERQRLERSVVELQMAFEQHRGALEDLQQQAVQLQGKDQSFFQYLEQVREQFWQLRTDLGEQLSAIAQFEDQHRRRQVAELEQQLKELRVWTPSPPRS